MEVQSQEVKKLFEEYNKMVCGFDLQDGSHSHHYMFNPCSFMFLYIEETFYASPRNEFT